MKETLDKDRLRRLIEVGGSLMSELDLDTLLSQLLDVAHKLTGARYAALGILDEEHREIERFITHGIDSTVHRTIGDPPRGRGILGLLIEDAVPLRLHDLSQHPRSYGFPADHPPMHSFLGVPIVIGGEAWGNLYLTDKKGGDFTLADEQATTILACWAAIAIENAGLYGHLQVRRDELARTVRNFEATATITRAVGAETRLDLILELIVKRGRALIDARAMLILLREEEDLTIAACAGEVDESTIGRRIPVDGCAVAAVLDSLRPERIPDLASHLHVAPGELGLRITSGQLGVNGAHAALLVPLEFRGQRLGVLLALDRIGEEIAFDADQQTLLLAFAASAATAVATAQSVERRRLRNSMAVAERERQRWARELHDGTLQGLASFQVLVDTALQTHDPDRIEQAMRTLGKRIGREIDELRKLIADLRPVALDERGLRPALEDLASDVSVSAGIHIEAEVGLQDGSDKDDDDLLAPDLAVTVYRIVQEALTNIVRHADAHNVAIGVTLRDGGVEVSVRDDGSGFDPASPRDGYGIDGMQERVELANGTLAITSAPNGGTTVQAWLLNDDRAAA
ncbi:MAG TPA: GAF domain-containing protein [Solirubrobacteraceae bacterium]|jgi:signal transduction histidine kinase|nr:GAF domain-containing protein [Solirubrobacteraceae bacterium]